MQWYELNSGPLRALKVLLDTPLSFNSLEYLGRTFTNKGIEIDPNLRELCEIFESTRLELLKGVSGVGFYLSQTGKLNPSNFDLTSRPIRAIYKDFVENDSGLIEKVCDATNIQIDRLLESFGVKACHSDSINESISNFISFYLLSEAVFLSLVGMVKIKISHDTIELAPKNDCVVKQLHRKWFANYWEHCSSLSSLAYLDLLEPGIESDSHFPVLIETLATQFQDKIFSLPSDKLPNRIKRLDSIQWAMKLCKLIVLCLWCQLKGKMNYAPLNLIQKIGISAEDLTLLSTMLENYSEPDRIFSLRPTGMILVNPSMTDQLRLILNDLANEFSEKNLNNILGKFFENEHVKGYFGNSGLSEKYAVYDGVLPHQIKNTELNPDVDFILRDRRRNRYYFIQVKYLKIGGKNYISGDLDHILSGKLIKGIKQISDAKIALNTDEFQSILESRGIIGANSDNSTFLLIHNIYNFDFCKWPSGVLSYEWNSIRNLFNDGQVISGHSKSIPNVSQLSRCLPLEEPDEVIDILMKKVPVSSFGKASTLFETDKVKLEVKLSGRKFIMSGLGL